MPTNAQQMRKRENRTNPTWEQIVLKAEEDIEGGKQKKIIDFLEKNKWK